MARPLWSGSSRELTSAVLVSSSLWMASSSRSQASLICLSLWSTSTRSIQRSRIMSATANAAFSSRSASSTRCRARRPKASRAPRSAASLARRIVHAHRSLGMPQGGRTPPNREADEAPRIRSAVPLLADAGHGLWRPSPSPRTRSARTTGEDWRAAAARTPNCPNHRWPRRHLV